MKVKICGLTNLEDALAAVNAGADMLGFNFYPKSPRFITPVHCASLVAELRERGTSTRMIGVFVNQSADEIVRILNSCNLDLAQLSGDEPPETLAQLGSRAFKALRPSNSSTLANELERFTPHPTPPAWLVDASRPGEYGGTGKVANWELARQMAAQAPILLAGGLKPENVAEAIKQVHPWGVDVASGVEMLPGTGTSPRHKDPARLIAFIQAAKQTYSQ